MQKAFHNLIKEYTQTLYNVNGFRNPIIIGKVSDELDSYLLQNGVRFWAYITAHNPMSEELSKEENENRNSKLNKDIKNYKILEGIGVNPDSGWIGEKSFLILGISKNNATKLAKKYGQKAIVYGEVGTPATLLITI